MADPADLGFAFETRSASSDDLLEAVGLSTRNERGITLATEAAKTGSAVSAGRSTGGVGRPPGSSGDDTRLLILRQARACFAEFGYASTANRMIAERAGLTTTALYHHFGKKQDLMLAVHRVTQTENYARMRTAIDSCDTFVSKVQALLDVTHQTLEEDPEQALFASVARDEARRHPELGEILLDRRFPDLFAELIEFGIRSGDLSAEDATAATGVISILALGSAFVAPT